jgi:hypothetical protein
MAILTAPFLLLAGPASATPDAADTKADTQAAAPVYPWIEDGTAVPEEGRTLKSAFDTPPGFARVPLEPGSFGHWLRHLPLAPDGTPISLYDGSTDVLQSAAAAIVALDIGFKDLQQCADAIIRLRAEYLRAADRTEDLVFNFTSGDAVPYSRWLAGERPVVRGNDVTWATPAEPAADTREVFQAWLEEIFMYAGSLSLERDTARVETYERLRPGDFVVEGGTPGHAVLVLDVARHEDGRQAVLLGQSYMPAQSFHVLVNFEDRAGGAWYVIENDESRLATPDWRTPFGPHHLRRFE